MANKKYDDYTKEELVAELETLKKKKYGLIWDKKNSQEMLDAFVNWENVPEDFVPKQFPVLKEIKNKEIKNGKDKPINLLIEGDNYHSLAVLNFTHQNKVDVIYIDPPYNTGNKDFIFNDTFLDKKGHKFVEKEDPWRHSKWLSFMEKRLVLSKKLLKRTGIIFISIDDNEIAQLKLLCDEVFGEQNFITNFLWRRTKTPPRLSKNVARVHDYILCYAKDIIFAQLNKIPLSAEYIKKTYKNSDNDPRGIWRLVPLLQPDSSANKEFSIIMPDGRSIKGKWRCSKETFDQYVKDNRLVVSKDGSPNRKLFLSEIDGQIVDTWLDDIATNEMASKEIEEFFGTNAYFSSPKPTDLIKFIVKIGGKENLTILDFFAGSGTTGQAVLELNNEDGGNRKFILCTNNEEINNNGSKIKHKICTDVCYPRVEKVINGYKNSKGKKIAGLGGNLKYFKTDFVSSDSTDKNKRDLVNKSAEMICIKEDIFDLAVDGGLDFKIYQNGKKFLGVIFDIDAIADFKKEAEKHKGNFVIYCFSYTEATPEKEFKGLKNKYILKPIPAVILRIYLEIFKK